MASATNDKKEAARYKALYKGLHLVFTNKFIDAETHFEAHSKDEALTASIRANHLVLLGFVKFFRALSTWGKTAIDKALEAMWQAEALAQTDTSDKLGAKLVQAHACFQGAFLQILQKRFAKAAWNIRTSWKHFESALTDLKVFEGSPQVKAEHEVSAKLGVGAFNLILSLMPPLVIMVTKILGFSADRQLGLNLLREAYSAQGLMSPIAGQVLLTYLTTIASMLAEQDEEMRKEADSVLADILKRHPNGVFFLWTKTSYLRSCRKHEEAVECGRLAESVCKEVPALAMMSVWQCAWCHMLLCAWDHCKKCFLRILESDSKTTQDGVPGFYCYAAALSAGNSGEYKEAEDLLRRTQETAKNLDIPHEQYSIFQSKYILKILNKARGKRKEGYPDKFKCTVYLQQLQLIIEWNFVKYFPDHVRQKVLETATSWYERRKELGWGDKEMAWYHLLIAHISFMDGNIEKAKYLGSHAVGYAKRAKASNSTLLSQCYFFMANIYLSIDPPDYDKAAKKCSRAKEKCTGDLSKRMSFLLHALKSRIARLKSDSDLTKKGKTVDTKKGKTVDKKEEEQGALSGAVGMVSNAVKWGWGAMTGGEEDVSDDDIAIDTLEITRQPTVDSVSK
eukprot:CAMPEP_0114517280 /NCGR_PEP_ID=MMETSP0109-20121206/17805_1 /TAXON_ID=29199 /ORGANISM="Chlorarachnion reptans, Strain CCCM449" /LENGTH=621 /DNA_ID=CAMNT_0001697781 /DNA_START=69 /DNA_END=1934 /DNA_ORIENTATION=+